jgi:Lsr2
MLTLRCCGWAVDRGLVRVQAASPQGRQGMAQKVTVALEDDLTGGPADETVRFAVDGPAMRST